MPTKDYRDDELLRRWISGAITAPEEAELERRARLDEGLQEALSALQTDPETDHLTRVSSMLTKARVTPAARTAKLPPQRRRPRYFTYAIAASVLMLLGLSVWLLPDYFSASSEAEIALDRRSPRPSVAASPLPIDPSPAAPPPQVEADQELPAEEIPRSRAAPPPPPVVVEAVPEMAEEEVLETDAIAESQAAPPATVPTERLPAPTLAAPATASDVAPTAAATLSGTVTDEAGDPIADAEILRPGQALGVTTDSAGRFVLDRDLTLRELIVQAPGYETEEVEVFSTEEPLQLALTPLPQRTEGDLFRENAARARVNIEPVVRTPPRAEPREGYRQLRERIEAGKPVDVPAGRVRVSFLVQPDGSLSDFRFRGQPDRATMDYVGKMLVESSAWEVVTGAAPVRVYFNLRFE